MVTLSAALALTVRDACSAHDHPTVITHNYGQAGAIEACTEVPVWSGHMSFYNWGPPPGPGNVLLVGFDNHPSTTARSSRNTTTPRRTKKTARR